MINDYIYSNQFIATVFYIFMFSVSYILYSKYNSNYKKSKKSLIQKSIIFKLLYRPIQFFTLAVCILSINTDYSFLYKFHSRIDLLYLGVSISSLSIALFATAIINLGSSYSPCYDSYIPNDIIVTGIYKYIRHPIYTSNILLIVGVMLSSGSLLVAFPLFYILIYYTISALNEESALESRFPKYKRYRRHTGMFLPMPRRQNV